MRWWDVEALLPLERELFGADAWSAEVWWSELAHPQGRWYLVARTDGTGTAGGALVGYAGVMVSDREADVQTVAVAPAAQGRGLGATLLTALLERAAEQGARTVTLEVRADNAAAIALYQRHGFARIAVRRGYYGPEGADAWIMQR
jgi:[ribosomal protein S18]-alanine N-acetyltransferase